MKAGKVKSRPPQTGKPNHRVIRDFAAKTRRKELIGQVRRSLAGLTQKYLSPIAPNDLFPSEDELNHLRTSAGDLYQDQGKKFPKYEKGWKVFDQVAKRYPTLRLTLFCDRLMRKLEAIPIGPLSRITQKIEGLKSTDSNSAERLEKIVQLLDQEKPPSLNEVPWANYYLLLRPFASDGFEDRMIPRPSGEKNVEWSKEVKSCHGVLGWATFTDIWEQAKAWQLTYDPSGRVEVCRFWLQVLHDEKIDTRLWNISRADSDALTSEEHMSELARRGANERQRRSRASRSL